MPTPRETIRAALHARLSALPATALRGGGLPQRMPAAGLLILRDGEPGEPEVTLSPLRCHHRHSAGIEAVVQGAARDAAFDTLCASIGAALAADRTLGGVCDWVGAEAPRLIGLPVKGAASLDRLRKKSAIWTVFLRPWGQPLVFGWFAPRACPVGTCFWGHWAKAGQSGQIAGGRGQDEARAHPFGAAIGGPGHAAHGFGPAEGEEEQTTIRGTVVPTQVDAFAVLDGQGGTLVPGRATVGR